MTLNLSPFEMVGGFAAHNSAPSMAVPAVSRAIDCSRKSSSSFSVRSGLSSRISAVDKTDAVASSEMEQDYSRTPYVPIYVMLPRWIINMDRGLSNPADLRKQLSRLKSMNVDGVKVECWWGLVEPQVPKYYDWSQYRALFQIVRDLKLKLQVVLCFHACVGLVWDGVHIPLPRWVTEVGKKDPDIFFTNRDGRRNYECLTWGIDDQRVLMNRTAYEVYRDFMISFREELEEFIVDGFISKIEIGLGPCGELRFPSITGIGETRFLSHTSTASRGWEYPPIKEFQCYDKYMMKSLKKAWKERGDSLYGARPTGSYSYSPRETKYFDGRRAYFSFYGRFFLEWYSSVLVDHADKLLFLGKNTFSHYCNISAKIPGICHLWYEPNIHIERLIGGYYNCTEGDAPIISILNKYKTTLNCTCPELLAIDRGEDFPEALADEIGLGWQVLYAAWDVGIPVFGENELPFYDRRGYHEILEMAKPINDPVGRHLSTFTYLRLDPQLMLKDNLREFERFVQRMHGESTT